MAPSCVTSAPHFPLGIWIPGVNRCDGHLLTSQVMRWYDTQQNPGHMVPSTTSHAQGPLIQRKLTLSVTAKGPSASWPTWDPEAKIPMLLGQRPSQAGPAGGDNPAGSSLCRAAAHTSVRAFRLGSLSLVHLGDRGGKCGEAGHLTKTGPLRVEIKLGAQGSESVVERCSTCQRERSASRSHACLGCDSPRSQALSPSHY